MTTCVLWDWNGTLLNDVSINLAVLNGLLKERNLETLSLEKYRELFRMPIIDFYKDIGFVFKDESFEETAAKYFTRYENEFDKIELTQNIEYILNEIKKKGFNQYIVSATPQAELIEQVQKKKIAGYFSEIIGNDNYKVASKKHRAVELVTRIGKDNSFVFIGDMDHDYEVAEKIGAKCILYNKGHQKINKSSGYIVVEKMEEVLDYL
jgi:phosphoglycolate phosphatase